MSNQRPELLWQDSIDDIYRHYQAERHPSRRARLRALWLLQGGSPIAEVAEEIGVSPRTVQRWIALYRRDGLEEVLHRVPGHQAAGRKPRLSPDQLARLAVLSRTGAFPCVGDAIRWVRHKWGIDYTYKGMHSLLKRLRNRE